MIETSVTETVFLEVLRRKGWLELPEDEGEIERLLREEGSA